MNQDQQKEASHEKSTAFSASGGGGDGRNRLSGFTDGVLSGLRPVGPALRLLLVTSIGVLAIMLLGAAAIYAAHAFGPPISRLLTTFGEALLILGALGLLIGSVRAWGQMIRMILPRTGGKVDSTGGEHNDH